jgi:ribonucleotide monophosphatase NagD (HAD superfamily)
VTSEESGQDKPNQASFVIALNKLFPIINSTDTKPQGGKVWMIGDNVTSDLEGAKTAINATTLALKSEIGNHADNNSIDMIFDSFIDLEKFVHEKNWYEN